jgi:copper chaperone CopZ
MTNRQRTYTVTGMSCGHCALTVREEVTELAGVEEADVDLETGRLTVTGAEFSDDEVRGAVAAAGYAVVAASPNGGLDGEAD